ncbi:MAG: domain containing protein [Actinotalea sp.]|nr:domain containing protein [Actinotalea sp.]
MSTTTCPNGHATTATDYCDTCGAPMAVGAAAVSGAGTGPSAGVPGSSAATGAGTSPSPAGSVSPTCPHCQTVNLADALFCEACGYDFTTGAMPRGAGPSSLDLPAAAGAGADAPAAGAGGDAVTAGTGAGAGSVAPTVPLEWVAEVWVDPDWYAVQDSEEALPSPGLPAVVPLTVRSLLVGRVSKSRNIHPQVDCGGDTGVSRRQAQLSTDGTRWWIEDLQSSNGTFVGAASGPLPTDPLTPGQRRELAEGDRVYVGAWTRLVVRRATDEEKGTVTPR